MNLTDALLIVPVAALHAAKSGLDHLGIKVTTHVSAGVGHRVDPAGIRLGGDSIGWALT